MDKHTIKHNKKTPIRQLEIKCEHQCIGQRTRSHNKKSRVKRNNKNAIKYFDHKLKANQNQQIKMHKSKLIGKNISKFRESQTKKQQKLQKPKYKIAIDKKVLYIKKQQNAIGKQEENARILLETSKPSKQRQDMPQNKQKLEISIKKVKLQKSRSQQPRKSNYQYVDICFCIDATGSMTAEIHELQNVMNSIIEAIESTFTTESISLRFAIVSYRDHNPQETTYVTKYLDFTDHQQSIAYLQTLHAFGGGDEPQAVLDGLYESAHSLSWATTPYILTKKYLIHIADAQPHGRQYGNENQQLGCTCGITTEDVANQINNKNITYAFMKIRNNKKLDIMEKVFKQKIKSFISTKIEHPKEMIAFIPKMIADHMTQL